MRVTIMRSAQFSCEPNCREWISAEGDIDGASLGKIRAAMDVVRPAKPPIFIHSGGGQIDAAMAIGRLIRARGFEIAVSRTEFAPSAVPTPLAAGTGKAPRAFGFARSSKAVCASACTLILAGGTRRHVGWQAHVGVHDMIMPARTYTQWIRYYEKSSLRKGDRVVREETRLVGEKRIQKHVARSKPPPELYRRVRAYLAEMGVSRSIVDLMLTAPPERMRWLMKEELQITGLATDARSYEIEAGAMPPQPTYQRLRMLMAASPKASATPTTAPESPPAPVAAAARSAEPSRPVLRRDLVAPTLVAAVALFWLVGSRILRFVRFGRRSRAAETTKPIRAHEALAQKPSTCDPACGRRRA